MMRQKTRFEKAYTKQATGGQSMCIWVSSVHGEDDTRLNRTGGRCAGTKNDFFSDQALTLAAIAPFADAGGIEGRTFWAGRPDFN